ncbi:pyroglutamyl-peptidase I [Mizugakiibacter sediminis]|uniref:Pyrrolidone-carboxylate peptidase n=1 Tax=Mizugakiibacter sediminis TaxID=1475481 RepID=A0A0S6YYX4_9GAMM|nr:pyroglutamyl-peptidase I [Mizugakiibacter sediminis]
MTKRLPCVLLTGFDPFDGEPLNPSWETVHALHGARIAGHRVAAAQLPTEFGRSLVELRRAIAAHRPALVLAVGQAGGRSRISIERVAINVDDARIPDNAGLQPVDRPIVADGPTAYFSTLPIKAMLAALQRAGIPAEISQTAGTYVCNHVFYGLMHQTARRRGVRAGFVHIPYLPEQAVRHRDAPSMAREDVLRALRLLVRVALTTREDARIAAGATA